MSTRSTTHFRDTLDGPSTAIVYRHHDGYPSGAGVDLVRFIKQVKEQTSREGASYYGTRFNDPSYLSAKYLTFLVTEGYGYDMRYPLDFGGVGILNDDPGDIEYRYIVVCDGGWDAGTEPTLYVQKIGWNEPDGEPEFVEDAIKADLDEQAKV